TTISTSSGTACIASHTESWRVGPPGTTTSGTRRASVASARRVRSTCAAGAATAIAATPGYRVKQPTVFVTTGTRWIVRNCFGMRLPKRAPIPPAGIATAISGPPERAPNTPGGGRARDSRRRRARLRHGPHGSAEQHGQGVADRGHAADVERGLRRLEDIALGHDRAAEAERGRLAKGGPRHGERG